jgi:hypothetical protein
MHSCDEKCGWVASLVACLAFGSFAIPIKGRAANKVQIDPVSKVTALNYSLTYSEKLSHCFFVVKYVASLVSDAELQNRYVFPDMLDCSPFW